MNTTIIIEYEFRIYCNRTKHKVPIEILIESIFSYGTYVSKRVNFKNNIPIYFLQSSQYIKIDIQKHHYI